MVKVGCSKCPICGGALKRYDRVRRIVKEKYGVASWRKIARFRCVHCGQLHRALPRDLYPFKHYHADIIDGVREGLITCETLGFEDYPCELTMRRWSARI